MKLPAPQLAAHLKKNLAPVYLLTGDEPLQMMEYADLIRKTVLQQGFTEKVILTVEAGFDWSSLDAQASSLSLFASRRLLDLRLGDKTFAEAGVKFLVNFLEQPPLDTLLLITADKLDNKQQKAHWFTAIEKHGVIATVQEIEIHELPAWISQRAQNLGLHLSNEAAELIADRSEGHLLACAQELEKLKLLYGEAQVDVTQVLEAVVDNSRFEVFDWVETVLNGDAERSVRQLRNLKEEGIEPILINWALQKEVRSLAQLTLALEHGQRFEQVCKTLFIWGHRQNLLKKASSRLPVQGWQTALKQTVKIDKMIKGVELGDIWNELQRLSLRVAGVTLFRTKR